MIYQPTDGELLDRLTECRPKTCFLMTQLGKPVPAVVGEIRNKLVNLLRRHGIKLLDANAEVTGRDILLKIWEMILSVPMGIAVVDKGMKNKAIQNVYYEIGVMQAYGKETLVVRTPGTEVPSDFVRTEYVTYDNDFATNVSKFIKRCKKQADFYLVTGENVENNPPLSFDYYRRAYLMLARESIKGQARQLLKTTKNNVQCLDCPALERSWLSR
jgi:hypothetical protein